MGEEIRQYNEDGKVVAQRIMLEYTEYNRTGRLSGTVIAGRFQPEVSYDETN